MSKPAGYSRTQIALHWIVAAIIGTQFVFHESMVSAWRAVRRGGVPEFDPLVAAHVWGGLLILALAAWRLAIRLKRGAPPPPKEEHPSLKMAANIVHWTFYALMIVLPVTGAAAWFGGIGFAGEVHEFFKLPLLALVALHVAAALYHQFVLKTDVLARMKRAQPCRPRP
ncbi:MAG: cytochrome b/b6 domain-containing protein [Rhodobiaceae bacterium]|nr:cytochrome b/b6 domain-containing protein [Rhodobiaceae bacterium]MCC0041991.1 cytochrome b/b6 domain-containing protein [Rhodobiaceae bacterium]MCC0053393.1 cytochrome b/b6 domain-containing protein [Rhodobiaceae bacterium]